MAILKCKQEFKKESDIIQIFQRLCANAKFLRWSAISFRFRANSCVWAGQNNRSKGCCQRIDVPTTGFSKLKKWPAQAAVVVAKTA